MPYMLLKIRRLSAAWGWAAGRKGRGVQRGLPRLRVEEDKSRNGGVRGSTPD